MSIRVMIVDDHAMTRIGLRFMLQTFADMEVVGEATSGEEALAACVENQPDVILMDMLLPDMEGSAVTVVVKQRYPAVQVIALSSFQDRDLIERALQAGAISYVLKNVSAVELAQAIRNAVSGQATLAPEAVQALVATIHRPAAPAVELTDREREVLALLAQGQSNNQIAAQLHLSVATIKWHVSAILDKLGVGSRAEAIAQAWRDGLVR